MNISNAAATATALLLCTSSYVGASSTSSLPPQKCVGTNMIPTSDRSVLRINDAICRDDTKLGINSEGVYGVWNGEELVEKFANHVTELELSENDNASKVELTAYNRKDNIVRYMWHLQCRGLSGQGETKLTVHSDNKNIIRLKQGHGSQDKLWLVHPDGKSKLDSTEGRLCEFTDTGSHEMVEATSTSGTPTANTGRMIVFHSDRNLCMTTIRSVGIREDDRIALATCSADDDAERFIIDNRGRIRPASSHNLCVNVEASEGGEELRLADCGVANNHIWIHDSKGNLLPRGNNDEYCASYANGIIGGTITLEECSHLAAAWDFVDPSDYQETVVTNIEEDTTYQSSRQFLRWRKLVNTLDKE